MAQVRIFSLESHDLEGSCGSMLARLYIFAGLASPACRPRSLVDSAQGLRLAPLTGHLCWEWFRPEP